MRVWLVFAAAAALSFADSLTIDPASIDFASGKRVVRERDSSLDATNCWSGFKFYEGWCFKTSDPVSYAYQDAVNYCVSVGVHAPSIHNKQILDLWSNFTYTLQTQHFWTDAYCSSNGKTLVWEDGTPTDYMGPSGQMQNCQIGYGLHIHPDGFQKFDYGTGAPALCAYNTEAVPDAPTTLEPTTPEPTSIDVTAGYCSCEPQSVYLDIVFITDTSGDMTSKTVGDATATIQSTLYGLTFGTEFFQSNIGAIAFADNVQVVKNFGSFRTTADINTFSLPYLGGKATKMADAINQAAEMISSNGRDFTRGVIVMLSKSFNQLDAVNIQEASEAFKDDGGIFISIDYAKGMGIKGLENLATSGYYLKDGQTQNSLDAEILYAFCDANCFCPDGLYPYDVADQRGRYLPQGCYHVADVAAVYDAAEQNCLNQKGFVATVHNDEKNFFMMTIFPVKARYWLGIRKNGNKFEWSDGTIDPSTFWAPGNPVAGLDCVYGQQLQGFNSPWYSAPCTDPLKNSMTYACQLRPCDSEYDCFV